MVVCVYQAVIVKEETLYIHASETNTHDAPELCPGLEKLEKTNEIPN